uniref:Uncharacterized protein n=1 Tax=Dunaliella tertiolecta TaxID=3047 RepID=A0A7S3VNW7_DUNTE
MCAQPKHASTPSLRSLHTEACSSPSFEITDVQKHHQHVEHFESNVVHIESKHRHCQGRAKWGTVEQPNNTSVNLYGVDARSLAACHARTSRTDASSLQVFAVPAGCSASATPNRANVYVTLGRIHDERSSWMPATGSLKGGRRKVSLLVCVNGQVRQRDSW